MLYIINYADKKYEKIRKLNSFSARYIAKADKIIEFKPKDIDNDFISMNANIFKNKRGAGLWLWKPYIILKTLKRMNDGEYLFYSDSGVIFINNLSVLLEQINASNQFIMGFELPLLERQFTKKETFELLSYNEYNNNQILASYILFKKNEFSINFVNDWLENCKNIIALSPEKLTNIQEFDDFITHREDQSIFSILYNKSNLKPFKDPSQFGERPEEYKWNKSFSNWSKKWEYVGLSKDVSKVRHKKILIHCRNLNPFICLLKEFIKTFFLKLNSLNKGVKINEKDYKY